MNPTELDMIKQEMLSYGIEGLTEDLVPLKDTLTIISFKWNIEILTAILLGNTRFSSIKKLVPDVSDKVLMDRLKLLADEHLIIRKEEYGFPPKVEYELTEHALALYKVLHAMRDWGKEHRKICIK